MNNEQRHRESIEALQRERVGRPGRCTDPFPMPGCECVSCVNLRANADSWAKARDARKALRKGKR